MTNEEAEKVLNLLTTADGGCYHCANALILDFLKTFPAYKQLARIIYKSKFEKELELDD
jgi:hypothetical protein